MPKTIKVGLEYGFLGSPLTGLAITGLHLQVIPERARQLQANETGLKLMLGVYFNKRYHQYRTLHV